MNSLSMPRSAGQFRYVAAQGLSWWLSELSGLLPKSAQRLAGSIRSPELVLNFGSDRANLTQSGWPGSSKAIIPLDLNSGSPALGGGQYYGNAKVRILLDDDTVFHCRVELPTAAETSMAQILFHQLERLVPLEPTNITFAWRVAERIPARKALTVAITIVKKSMIDQATGFARALGFSPSAVLIMQDDGTERAVWRGPSTQKGSRLQWLLRAIESMTLATFLLAYGVGIVRLDSERSRLMQQLQLAQSHMVAVEAATKRLAETSSLLRAVEQRLTEPTPLAVLDELTKAMPPDASVSEFDFRQGQVSLVGTAVHSTALLNLRSRSAMFEDAQFLAPLTAAPGGAGEHFEMSLRLRKHGS